MKTHKFRVLLVIALNRVKKNNKAPVFLRITFNKKRKEFSTGLFINPDYWNNKKQKVYPSNEENDYINTQLSLIKQNVNQAFLFLQVQKEQFDVDDIYLKYKGENTTTQKTLLEVFELHNKKMMKLIDVEYTKSTYNKFIEAKKHTANFIS